MQWNDWPPRDASLMAGYELWRDGRLSEAQSFFEERMRSQPEDADVRRGLGNVSWSRKDFVSALRYYSQALRLEPWNPMHWGNMGLARRDLGQPEAAISAFRVALGLDPLYAPALNEWANVLFDMERYEEALPLYNASLAIDDGRAVVYHNKGVCLRHMGRLNEAVRHFRVALELEPGYRYSQEELQRLAFANLSPA